MSKIGQRIGYSQNGTWAMEYDYSPTDEFAARFKDKGGWKAAKAELHRLVNNQEAQLELTQPENAYHSMAWDIFE